MESLLKSGALTPPQTAFFMKLTFHISWTGANQHILTGGNLLEQKRKRKETNYPSPCFNYENISTLKSSGLKW